MSTRKKVVITGASGFLGSHLAEAMKDDERYEVLALTSRPDDLRKRVGGENAEYIHKDALSAEMFKDAVVINCAYPRNSNGTACADGLKYIQRVFESAVEGGAQAIINISSQSVYSQQRTEAATEDTDVCPESSYAVGKYAVELMLESICRERGTKYTNLRMASLIGPGFDQRIVNRFVRKLINHESVTVVRQPKRMGFLDVEDAVSAVLAVVNSATRSWELVYNVGNGQGYTVEEIYDAVAAELSKRTEIAPPVCDTGTDSSSTAVSFDLLNRDTGFVPAVDLDESVRRIIASL